MKVFLIGANGQLGTDLRQVLVSEGTSVVPVTHKDLDVRHAEAVFAAITEARPDVVISTAAYHRVEECETQAALAFEVNALGARNLAQACDRAGCILVNFSTDYVFDGKQQKPFSEVDLPHPLSVYGASKLAGEHLVSAVFDRYFVIRTCGLYGVAGSSGKGGNFVETMLKRAAAGSPLRVVNDQVLTPTFTVDLAHAVVKLIRTGQFGLIHISSEGECSWYDFAKAIFDLEKLEVDVAPVSTDQFPSLVKRPAYSVLLKKRLNTLGIEIPRWEDALARYLLARRAHQTTAVGEAR
ncbi:MAG TPA: dTDP-4-dehydrorhamnose reductase [Terriglobia bacterium]|nr:dTDP-4-dehydrorhamnose reductase [Terriglobia bacterium]